MKNTCRMGKKPNISNKSRMELAYFLLSSKECIVLKFSIKGKDLTRFKMELD